MCRKNVIRQNVIHKLSAAESQTPPTHKYHQQLYIHFVRDAVYAFANAIHNLHKDSCKNFGEDKLCDKFKERIFLDLVKYLRNVEFFDVDGNEFKFTGDGRNDGPPRYSIVSFQKTGSLYDWQNVGTFHANDNHDGIDCKDSAFCSKFDDANDPLFSKLKKCKRQECNISEIKVPDTNDKCCWHCKQCGVDEYKATEFECKPCPEGEWSGGPDTENRSFCVEKIESYLQYSDVYAIGTYINFRPIKT